MHRRGRAGPLRRGALAQDATGGGRSVKQPSTAVGADTAGAASRLPGGGTTRDLTKPGNGGVAGTGLGGSTAGAAQPGRGLSVKGPPGQGIDGQAAEVGRGSGAGRPSDGGAARGSAEPSGDGSGKP